MIRLAFLLIVIVLAITKVEGAEVAFESKPTQTHLIELFTSEGCSSCRSAEAWLSNLKNEPRLWQDIIPIAFHVDYWDHLGWRDPFASKLWTERQSDYSALWKIESVYTPAFALDGVAWHNTSLPPTATAKPGILRIVMDEDRVTATFRSEDKQTRHYEIHLARLGFGLGADVTAGENRGRKLVHDFVVLGLTHEIMKSDSKELRLPPESTQHDPKSRSAIAAWVTQVGQLEPIQAVGGWLR